MNINVDDMVHLMENISEIPFEGVQEIMGEILSSEPMIGWEMGPDPQNEECTYLALTCWGNIDRLLSLSKQLNPPIIGNGWSILVGSPKKNWDGYFEFVDDGGNKFEFEGRSWKYKINKKSEKLHITVFSNDFVDVKNVYDAVYLFMIGEIGEWMFAKYIVVDDIFPLDPLDAIPFGNLYEFLLNTYPDVH